MLPRYHLLLLLYGLALIYFQQCNACPSFCICKWKNGKQTVNCNGQNLSEIPDGLDPAIQVLNFSNNILRYLPNELFNHKKLINLQRIYLTHCKIKTVKENTFKGLTNLVELDLSFNLIESVPTASFQHCPSLMRLILNANPVKVLKKFGFNHLSFLNTLELSDCQLYEIEEGAFQGLHSLEWLMLDQNHLRTIRGISTLPENLKGVELRGNKWECDCHIRDFQVWLKSFNVPMAKEPDCEGPPRLARRLIKSVPTTDLACLPDVSPTTFYLELSEGKNVSLLCQVHAIPEAAVSWWFQGQALQNNSLVAPGVHLVYFIEEGAENKRSELFIYNANSEDNGTFICNAENPAGTAQSNFTIRIIIKEDPLVIVVALQYQHLVGIGIATGCFLLLLISLILMITSIRRCKRKRKRSLPEQTVKGLPPNEPLQSTETLNHMKPEESVLYIHQVNSIISSPHHILATSPPRNPDLINGTEGCHWGMAAAVPSPQQQSQQPSQQQMACLRTNSEIYGDVRWNNDSDGYPLDYGLPKLPSRTDYYRTLPCNRTKRHLLTTKRFTTRDAEYLPATNYYIAAAPVITPTPDVRYTIDGYPVTRRRSNNMCDDEIDECAPVSLPCCSGQWPPPFLHQTTTTSSSNIQVINPSLVQYNNNNNNNNNGSGIIKRCVSAQTDDEDVECCVVDRNDDASDGDGTMTNRIDPLNMNSHNSGSVNEILTESPDEGYEGEPSVV